MLGATLGGVLHDYFPRFTDLMLSIDFMIVAGSYVSIPWSPSLEVLSVLLFFGGLAKGNIDIGRHSFLEIKQANSNCCP